jgi:hypothetical protein
MSEQDQTNICYQLSIMQNMCRDNLALGICVLLGYEGDVMAVSNRDGD